MEVAGIEKRRMEAGEMSLILLLCPLGHGSLPAALPSTQLHNHREAAGPAPAHGAALQNSRFHFDLCLEDEKS